MQYSRAAKRHMLLPKGKHKDKTFVPVMEHFWLPSVLGKLAPPERRAMAEIVDNADVLTVDGAIWLLIPVRRQETLDVLAAFGAEGEDRENDLEDEEEVNISKISWLHATKLAEDEDIEEDDPGGTFGEL